MSFIHFRNWANLLTSYWRVSVRTIYSNSARLLTVLMLVVTAGLFAGLVGCGASGPSAATTTVSTSAAAIAMSTTAASVKSDNSDSVTITATALTSGNAVVSGVAMTFSSTSGQISTSTGTTDNSGKVSFSFSGGTEGFNRTATITASVTGTAVSNTMPIQITGSTLTLNAASTSLTAGTPVALTIVAKNAGNNPVSGQSLRYSFSVGTGNLSPTTGTTDSSGTATVNVTGTSSGALNVLVEWMNGATVTASATQTFTVAGAAGGSLSVTTPATSPFGVYMGATQPVVVNVPATINSVAVDRIRYVSTLGNWQGGTSVLTVLRTGATDTQTFVPGSINAGNANVQIDALDVNGTVLGSAAIVLAISSPAANANGITLQTSQSVLTPGATTTLSAFVRDIFNNPVGGANVQFSLVSSSGTGESILPVLIATDTTNSATTQMGRAKATFTAGSSTTQGASVRATVSGTLIFADAPITVGGTAGSIAITTSTKMSSVNSDTSYNIPVTVFVTDSNGGALQGAVVSLSLWPHRYYKGVRAANCAPIYLGSAVGPPVVIYTEFPNEDAANENLILDAGEDTDGPGGYSVGGFGAPDGKLWPPLASAGSIPSTVTTGADGTATFNWIYPKEYAHWMTVRLRATTQVQGNQSQAVTYLFMKVLATDVVVPCPLSDSPFN
jgi:adhesin/invasin